MSLLARPVCFGYVDQSGLCAPLRMQPRAPAAVMGSAMEGVVVEVASRTEAVGVTMAVRLAVVVGRAAGWQLLKPVPD